MISRIESYESLQSQKTILPTLTFLGFPRGIQTCDIHVIRIKSSLSFGGKQSQSSGIPEIFAFSTNKTQHYQFLKLLK